MLGGLRAANSGTSPSRVNKMNCVVLVVCVCMCLILSCSVLLLLLFVVCVWWFGAPLENHGAPPLTQVGASRNRAPRNFGKSFHRHVARTRENPCLACFESMCFFSFTSLEASNLQIAHETMLLQKRQLNTTLFFLCRTAIVRTKKKIW